MKLKLKILYKNWLIIFFNSILVLGGIFTKREKINITVADKLIVEPDTYIIQLNFLTAAYQKQDWAQGINKINKKEALKIIKEIENVTKK